MTSPEIMRASTTDRPMNQPALPGPSTSQKSLADLDLDFPACPGKDTCCIQPRFYSAAEMPRIPSVRRGASGPKRRVRNTVSCGDSDRDGWLLALDSDGRARSARQLACHVHDPTSTCRWTAETGRSRDINLTTLRFIPVTILGSITWGVVYCLAFGPVSPAKQELSP